MRELDLLQEYLVRLRTDLLREGHSVLVSSHDDLSLREARGYALKADLVDRIRGVVAELAKDPGEFIRKNLT